MLKFRIIQTFARRGNHINSSVSLLITISFCLFIQCVIAYSIQLDTALDCQDGEECLLWITSQKGKQKLVSGERKCAVLFA